MAERSTSPKPKKVVAKKSIKRTTSSKKSAAKKTAERPKKTVKTTKKTNSAKTKKVTASASAADTKSTKTNKFLSPARSEVVLPSNMSQRSITKSLTYKEYFKKFAQYAVPVMGAGLVFSGGVLALYASFTPNATLQVANICLSGDCDSIIITDLTKTTKETTETITTEQKPEVILKTKLPASVVEKIPVRVYASYTKKVAAVLRSDSGDTISLSVTPVANQKYYYDFAIDPASIPKNTYSVVIAAESEYGLGIYRSPIGKISVPAPIKEAVEPETAETTSSTTAEVESEAVLDSADELVEPVKTLEEPTKFALRPASQFMTGVVLLPISAPEKLTGIEVFALRQSSIDRLFLGAAFKLDQRWVYRFDTTTVPNGAYQLFARATSAAGELQTDSVRVEVYNTVEVPTSAEDADADQFETEEANQVDAASTDDQRSADIAVESAVNAEQRFAPTAILEDTVATTSVLRRESVRELMASYRSEVANVLRQYAVAVQGGDAMVIEAAKEEVDALRNELLAVASERPATEPALALLTEELTNRFAELLKKVDTFESVRRSRSTDASMALDTDKDGITDSDERSIYQTDPLQADTDNDGFTDGVEIVRGYDPLDATPEATIAYESPREVVAPVRDDVLRVDSVVPTIETDDSLTQPRVQATISGVALPNSFVTLYIFSTPIVVTIKTDATGAYSYQLEKELADGSHEVYAAITDNAGDIVASSLPFSFIKEAEAFTPVASAATPGITSAPASEVIVRQSYAVTVGLAVLAFGILLLLLGVRMRPEEIQQPVEVV